MQTGKNKLWMRIHSCLAGSESPGTYVLPTESEFLRVEPQKIHFNYMSPDSPIIPSDSDG